MMKTNKINVPEKHLMKSFSVQWFGIKGRDGGADCDIGWSE